MSPTARLLPALLLAYLGSLGLAWPDLPFNARLPDLLFPALGLALVAGMPRRPVGRWLDAVVAFYLLGALPSLLVTTDLGASGAELARQVYLVAVYAVIAAAISVGYARVVAAGVALGGAVLAAAALACALLFVVAGVEVRSAGQTMALPYVGEILRLRAFTASEAMLACVLTMAVPFALLLQRTASDARLKRAWALAAALGAVAAVLTFAVAASGVLVAGTIALWPRWRDRPAWRRAALATAVVGTVFLNLTVVASVRSLQVGERGLADRTSYHYGVDEGRAVLGSVEIDYAVMSYVRLKQLAWEAFVERPLTGVGLDRFHDVSERAYQAGRLTVGYRTIDPHSTLLGRLAETGVVGGFTLLLLWWTFGTTGLRLVRADGPGGWLALATVAGLAGLLVASINVDVMNLRVLWVGLGVIRGLSPPGREPAVGG